MPVGSPLLLGLTGTIPLAGAGAGPPAADPVVMAVAPRPNLRDLPEVALNGGPAARKAPPAVRLNTTGRDMPMGGPVSDNGFVLGEVSYVLTADDRIELDPHELLAVLTNVISPTVLKKVADATASARQISTAELSKFGITLAYDPSNFGLKMSVDPDLRQQQILHVNGGYGSARLGPVQEAEPVSAYLTAFVNSDYVYKGIDRGFSQPDIQFDGALRIHGLVFEGEGAFQNRFQRQGTRLVYDDQRHTARYTAGDLEPVSRGFSGTTPMAGLSISRVYADLDPQRNIQPTGQRSFTLTRSSTVETIVNGQTVQQARLNPGTYSMSDFPFAQGSNNVQLLIRDDSGRQSVISFSINFDRTLLAAGVSEFGLYGGVRAPYTVTGRHYTQTPVASGFYRRGVTEQLTLGGNFQAQNRGVVAGAEAVWAAPLGTLSFNLAGSKNDRVGNGYALNVGYEFTSAGSGNNTRSLTATFQATSRKFSLPDNETASNPFAYELGATYSQAFGANHYVSVDGYYAFGREGRTDQKTARVTYGWRPNQRLLLTAEASYEKSRSASGPGARLTLIYRFDRKSSITADGDTQRDRARLSYQRSSGTGVGSYNASANVDRVGDSTGLNANVNVLLNRAELGAAHYTSFANNGTITDQRTSLRTAFSIAYAGGAVALSRPIYDSFAIIKPHNSLAGASVYLDPRKDEYFAKSGLFGGAVMPQLNAYSPRLLTYDVPKAPAGYDIGSGVIQFRPPYRSGHLIEIGSDYFVTFTGRLIKPDGSALPLLAGYAIEEGKASGKPVEMFTNRNGNFAVQGLRAGKWRIEMTDDQHKYIYKFVVAPGDTALQRGGVLKPEGSQ